MPNVVTKMGIRRRLVIGNGISATTRVPLRLYKRITKMTFPGYYSFNRSLSLVFSSCSRLRSLKAQLKLPFLHKQSIDLSPRLYFSNIFNKSLFMPSGILLNACHGVFLSGMLGPYSSKCLCKWRLT
jgi:hypothetical protein